MLLFTEMGIRRTLPISLGIVFILMVNLAMIHHYYYSSSSGLGEPYQPPHYGLHLVRPKQRKYTSQVLEKYLESLDSVFKDRDLYILLQNCLPNTLDTTVEWFSDDKYDPRTFLITGDIPAMWIRDSTNQISPYLQFIKQDEGLRQLVLGVIQVQASYLVYDPYANAFLRPWYAPPSEHSQKGSTTDRVVPAYDPNIVWESKYELDSIGHFFQLTNDYIEASGDIERVVTSKDWLKALPRIFKVLQDQMEDTWPAKKIQFKSFKKTGGEPSPVSLKEGYRFRRQTDRPTETLGEYGIGGITRKCGLVRSAFRPSDDATTFPYLIPSNAQLSVQLIRLANYLDTYLGNRQDKMTYSQIARHARELGETIREAIYKHAVVSHSEFGDMFAFEVDCYGSHLLMDDANTPSLLSLPVLGFVKKNDRIYQNTRNFVLSKWNPWFFSSSFAEGIGGPHTGQNMVWPMSLLMQIQTSTSEAEVKTCLDMIKRMARHTGSLMCESFNVNQPTQFTRPWFSWANGLAGSTILGLIQDYPHLI
ncbi:uncharacterized protein B0P05DRAFT_547837 [Gilbertella persicaria]|uniref:uncharacterized protein n=1 Tax=Gilbertella persicaria TaxID=101096 RepID=UPI002220F9EC|nr:uncharacterized protein B0P05DRAFT_547837 [Gilbertella persicaria]KAI8074240.1 hypothetical protein B0P05DRAFT_547837 [Gilbertella persicaria]